MPSVAFPVEEVPPPVGFEPVEELPVFPVFPEFELSKEPFDELSPVELSGVLWFSEELSGKFSIMLLQIPSDELSPEELSG